MATIVHLRRPSPRYANDVKPSTVLFEKHFETACWRAALVPEKKGVGIDHD